LRLIQSINCALLPSLQQLDICHFHQDLVSAYNLYDFLLVPLLAPEPHLLVVLVAVTFSLFFFFLFVQLFVNILFLSLVFVPDGMQETVYLVKFLAWVQMLYLLKGLNLQLRFLLHQFCQFGQHLAHVSVDVVVRCHLVGRRKRLLLRTHLLLVGLSFNLRAEHHLEVVEPAFGFLFLLENELKHPLKRDQMNAPLAVVVRHLGSRLHYQTVAAF
jgi:hypothetical protein